MLSPGLVQVHAERRLLGEIWLDLLTIRRIFNEFMASVSLHVDKFGALSTSFNTDFAVTISRTFRLPMQQGSPLVIDER